MKLGSKGKGDFTLMRTKKLTWLEEKNWDERVIEKAEFLRYSKKEVFELKSISFL